MARRVCASAGLDAARDRPDTPGPMRPRLLEIPDAPLLAMVAAFAVILYGAYRAALALRESRGKALWHLGVAMAIGYVLIKHVALNPAFATAGIPIYAYGFMIMCAFASAILLSTERGRLMGLDPNRLMDLGLFAMIGGVAGSRLWHYLQYRDQYADVWQVFQIWKGGIVYYGGLVGGVLACSIYIVRTKMPYWITAEAVGPTLAIGLAFARLGCFLNGCCFGGKVATDSAFGLVFPAGSPAAIHHHGKTEGLGLASAPVHVTQLYESVATLVLFGLLTAYSNKVAKRPGESFFLFMLTYAPLRYGVEMLRDDTPRNWPGGLTAGQAAGVPLVLIGLVGFILARAGKLPGQGTTTLAALRADDAPIGTSAPAAPARA